MNIKKSKGATINTWETIVKGIKYHSRKAWLRNNYLCLVMFTSDKTGETISILDTETNNQYILPFEDIEKLIQHTRGQK